MSERGILQLVILEKAFDYTARASWAMQPLQTLEAGYGRRARLAADSGVDFKAFSHSLRVLEEIRQLHTTGRIVYPHEPVFAGVMRSVKLGDYTYDELVRMLDVKLEQARSAEALSVLAAEVDPRYTQEFMLSLY